MKIELLENLPVDTICGMTKGRVLEVIEDGQDDKIPGVWVTGDNGESVKVLNREFKVVS